MADSKTEELMGLADAMADIMKCPICLEFPNDLYLTHCGHVYCKYCLSQHMKGNYDCESSSSVNSWRRRECPVCKQKLRGLRNIKRSNDVLLREQFNLTRDLLTTIQDEIEIFKAKKLAFENQPSQAEERLQISDDEEPTVTDRTHELQISDDEEPTVTDRTQEQQISDDEEPTVTDRTQEPPSSEAKEQSVIDRTQELSTNLILNQQPDQIDSSDAVCMELPDQKGHERIQGKPRVVFYWRGPQLSRKKLVKFYRLGRFGEVTFPRNVISRDSGRDNIEDSAPIEEATVEVSLIRPPSSQRVAPNDLIQDLDTGNSVDLLSDFSFIKETPSQSEDDDDAEEMPPWNGASQNSNLSLISIAIRERIQKVKDNLVSVDEDSLSDEERFVEESSSSQDSLFRCKDQNRQGQATHPPVKDNLMSVDEDSLSDEERVVEESSSSQDSLFRCKDQNIQGQATHPPESSTDNQSGLRNRKRSYHEVMSSDDEYDIFATNNNSNSESSATREKRMLTADPATSQYRNLGTDTAPSPRIEWWESD